eukprot:11444104-Alexandrium_andersonii.AAC.1
MHLCPNLREADLRNRTQVSIFQEVRLARGMPQLEVLLRRRWAARWADKFRQGLTMGVAVR